jgi:hypothetical protein
MQSINSIRSTTARFLLGAAIALWRSTIALGATPPDDPQAQAQALLNPPIVHSNTGRESYRRAGDNRHVDAADDAHRQAQRLLLGIRNRDSEAKTPTAGAGRLQHAASAALQSPMGDPQDAARRMILGRDDHAGRTARRPGVPTATHLADRWHARSRLRRLPGDLTN